MLLGRESERRRIEQLLDDVRRGRSRTLVLSGEAGIGKTALLREAAAMADGMTVVTATGIEADAELEFSGLLALCRPILDALEDIPEHQAAALRGALGLSPARERDRFAVGAATLGLLASAGERRPLLAVVDDAQWLDAASADALRFAARRLDADRVGFLFALRTSETADRPTHGFDTVELGGLGLEDARALLAHAVVQDLPAAVSARLHAATHGNPLALVELPRLLTAEQLDGRSPVAEPLPVGRSVEGAYLRRVEHLPSDSRRALVVVAAASDDELEPIVSALSALGPGAAALQAAEDEGLLAIEDGRARFRHPLVRSAVYHSAGAADRRRAHAALAAALERTGDLDRAARHLASAAIGPNEAVAAKLAAAGERAGARTAFAAAADAFELAARLSPDRHARGERLAAAAESAWAAGAGDRAVALVEEALVLAKERRLCARLLQLRGRIELQAGTLAEARGRFEKAAALIERIDPGAAAIGLTYVVFSCHFQGRIADALGAARRARALTPPDGSAADLRVDYVLGRSLLLAGDYDAGTPLVERMVTAALGSDDVPRTQVAAAAIVLTVLERHREAAEVMGRVLALARREGPMALVYALSASAEGELRGGRLPRAVASATEGLMLARELGQSNIAATFLAVLAHADAVCGDQASFHRHAADARSRLAEAGMALPLEQLRCSEALLALGLGRLDDAAATLEEACESVAAMGLVDRDAAPEPELVEILAALGRPSEAHGRLDGWVERISPSSVPWAAPLLARCRGVLADDGTFEEHFLEALLLHGDANAFARARTLLCFGERLRRAGRKTEARERLREAHAIFMSLEATPWSDRARRELRATGERLRRVRPEEGDELTPQELQVALQVAEGKTNKEAGAALFLSPKTVEFHLARVYRKLDLSSRAELIRHFAAGDALAAA